MKQKFLLLFTMLALSACSTLVSGRLQDIKVSTKPEVEASCMLSNDKGDWFVESTPETIEINSSYHDLHVICEEEGGSYSETTFKSSAKRSMFANILIGGVPGAIIDGLNGAGFAYPEKIEVSLSADKK